MTNPVKINVVMATPDSPVLPRTGSGSIGGVWMEESVELADGQIRTRLELIRETFGDTSVSSGISEGEIPRLLPK